MVTITWGSFSHFAPQFSCHYIIKLLVEGIPAAENLGGDVFRFVSCWLHIPIQVLVPIQLSSIFEIITFPRVTLQHMVSGQLDFCCHPIY